MRLIVKSRYFTRVDYSQCASVKHDDQVFFGDIKNVSLQGLYITTSQEIPVSSTIEITICNEDNTSYRYRANVVRCEENGFGVQLKEMGVQAFTHLRSIIARQCNNLELLISETCRMSACIQ